MDQYFEKIKTEIIKQIESEEYQLAFGKSEQGVIDKNHALEVVMITEKLWNENESKPFPQALKIAALVHDSDRFYPRRMVDTKDCPEDQYEYRKGIHSGNTAIIFQEMFKDILPIEIIRDICFLILRHEHGGDQKKDRSLTEKQDEHTNTYNLNKAANYLFYADKLSFFYSNIYEYSKRGEEKLKKKVIFSLEGLPISIKEKIKSISYDNELIKRVVNGCL